MTRESSANIGTVDALAEWIITLVLFGIMIAAFLAALDWPPNAALFPLVLSGLAICMLALKLLFMLTKTLTPSAIAASATDKSMTTEPSEVGSELDEPPPGVFATAGSGAWGEALLCLLIFFTMLTLFGVLVTLVIFGIGYLKLVGKRSLLFSALYIGALIGVVYLLFVQTLSLPLPEGIFFP